ncbi:MAG: hypothetical protein C4539_12750 [Ignavibacteriales bacterium]|nr:MAG: hypothetical protein C4539_12750 [Ignavibacteriales bacterium]
MKMKLNMLNSKKILVSLMSLLVITLFVGCDEDTTPSLWDSRPPEGVKPVIASLTPPTESLAGVDEVTITGTGFSSVVANNIVYFGSAKATVLQASETQLIVRVPNNPKDTLQVKCTVTNSDYFSEPVQYRLRVAAGEAVKVANRAPNCMTVDKAGNIYIHAKNSKTEKEIGFIKIATDGTETAFAPTGSATSSVIFTTMKCGPDNNLLCIRSATKAIFEVKENTAAKAWASGFAGNIADFDFDNKGYVWAGGASGNAQLYRISYSNPKRIEKYAFTGDVKSVRYFQSALYVAATRDNAEKLFKIPVVSDSVLDVANAVEYFNFTPTYPTVQIKSITISQDGTIYAGNSDTTSTTAPPIIMVKTDRTSEIFFSVLLGDAIYGTPVQSLAWGISDDLYFLRGKTSAHTQEVVRVITKKYSAPYYGRGDL